MSTKLQVVGNNRWSEFGTNIDRNFATLKSINIDKYSTKIEEIISGDDFSFFCNNDKDQNIWSAGYNDEGQCATSYFHKIIDDGFHQIKYFQDNNIRIKKICTNVRALMVFWITESNQVYANGENHSYELGLGHNTHQCIPILIESLKDVIDIQCARSYAIALCSNNSPNTIIIIQFWCRTSNIDLPADITNTMMTFYNSTKVFSTGYSYTRAHGQTSHDKQVTEWTEIDGLKDKQIEKIRVGSDHSFFLDAAECVWCCGRNENGQLGLGHTGRVDGIVEINFFVKNDIQIQMIECGAFFSMMVDCDGRVWMFGSNLDGQIGDESEGDVDEPRELVMFRDLKVEKIRCGSNHCYLRCDGDKHYLWGHNNYHECLVFDNDMDVKKPHLVELGGKVIKDVFLGNNNTKIIFCDSNLVRNTFLIDQPL